MAAPPIHPRRALVIKLGHIGDVLVTTPLMSALKQAWPGLTITALVNQGTEAMVKGGAAADEVMVLRRDLNGPGQALRFHLDFLRSLRRRRFDLALELSGNDRGAFLAWASGAPWRVGFRPKKRHLRSAAFHQLVNGRGTSDHMVEIFLRQAHALGITPQDTGLRLAPSPQAEAQAEGLLARAGLKAGGYVLVHPTSRWMFKSWTPEGNAGLIEHLRRRGLPVVLSSGPDEPELNFVSQVRRLLAEPVALDLCGKLTLPLLGALIARARLFCGVDSAPMHMAAALGVPVLALFGPSGEQMWGPWRVAHEVVSIDISCRPCGKAGCSDSKVSRCLTELAPAEVWQALDRLLDRT